MKNDKLWTADGHMAAYHLGSPCTLSLSSWGSLRLAISTTCSLAISAAVLVIVIQCDCNNDEDSGGVCAYAHRSRSYDSIHNAAQKSHLCLMKTGFPLHFTVSVVPSAIPPTSNSADANASTSAEGLILDTNCDKCSHMSEQLQSTIYC